MYRYTQLIVQSHVNLSYYDDPSNVKKFNGPIKGLYEGVEDNVRDTWFNCIKYLQSSEIWEI